MRELKDTVEDMLSEDAHRRLVAEFDQLAIRFDALSKFLKDCNPEDENSVVTSSEYELMFLQATVMQSYMWALAQRLELLSISSSEDK